MRADSIIHIIPLQQGLIEFRYMGLCQSKETLSSALREAGLEQRVTLLGQGADYFYSIYGGIIRLNMVVENYEEMLHIVSIISTIMVIYVIP